MSTEHEDKKKCYCGSPMNIPYEDKKLHKYGILDTLLGYKEWFHYAATFTVNKKQLTCVLGSPVTSNLEGILGWISFDGKQYSLAGNPGIPGCPGFFHLEKKAEIEEYEKYYTITYPKNPQNPQKGKGYTGTIKGKFPHYQITIDTPDLNLTIEMSINPENSPEKSVCTRSVRPLLWGAWFHSGDIDASLKGHINKKEIDTKGKGWYERNWVHVPIPVPAKWFWILTFPESGGAFDLLIEGFRGWRLHYLDECWLYWEGKFYEFHKYRAWFSDDLKRAIKKKDLSDIKGKKIYCKGKNGKNWFNITAKVTDFRQYNYCNKNGRVIWMNPFIETQGEAYIDGESIDMKGTGLSEQANITYWW
ncbi:MAG: hypothetical protein PVF58_04620 [Candidatus Methanofastidiosia archaeon]|jgi:hypothetical protein